MPLLLVASLLLAVRPGAPKGFLLLVASRLCEVFCFFGNAMVRHCTEVPLRVECPPNSMSHTVSPICGKRPAKEEQRASLLGARMLL